MLPAFSPSAIPFAAWLVSPARSPMAIAPAP